MSNPDPDFDPYYYDPALAEDGDAAGEQRDEPPAM